MTFLQGGGPTINISEIDQTTTVPGTSTVTGAFVGNFRWGPAEEVINIASENDLVSVFGAPDKTNTVDFHTAAYFLKYGSSLNVVRELTSAAYSANAGGHATTLIKNKDDYNDATLTFANVGLWVAKYPGALGNSLKVSLFAYTGSSNASDFTAWTYSNRFDGAPSTSAYASARNATGDEMHVVVIDEDGSFTGTPNTILETFPFVSQASDALNEDGSSNYFKDVINNTSNYIWFGDEDATNFTQMGSAITSGKDYTTQDSDGVVDVSLSGGVDSAALTSSEFASGWDLFEDKDTTSAFLLIAPDLPSGSETTVANDVISVAAGRKDAVAFISPAKDDLTASAIKTFADALTASSYAFVDSGRLKVYDKYNDQDINIPACSSVAGLAAATETQFGAWFSPAGFARGQIFGVTKLYYNPKDTDRDTLFRAGVNPIVTFPGQGTILFGDKTHLNRPSAFGELGVRRLFSVLESSIATAAQSQLFEFNDEFTRSGFLNIVEPFLRDVQGRRGLSDFRVVCDESNNTSSVIDRNEFVADIYIKPNRSIRYIQLNFVATRSGVEFNEVVGG